MPMARESSRAGITDVARLAGVSLSTVSRAMNGNPTVDPALAERVQAAAAELGYTANPVARSLVLGRTQTVAVVIPDGVPAAEPLIPASFGRWESEGIATPRYAEVSLPWLKT